MGLELEVSEDGGPVTWASSENHGGCWEGGQGDTFQRPGGAWGQGPPPRDKVAILSEVSASPANQVGAGRPTAQTPQRGTSSAPLESGPGLGHPLRTRPTFPHPPTPRLPESPWAVSTGNK